MKTILDFESRSHVDLKKKGVYVYAADPSTEILCCAVKMEDAATVIWFPKLWAAGVNEVNGHRIICNDALYDTIEATDIFGAHNAQFERLMWQIMEREHGMPPTPLAKWQCSAARAAALALPRHLGQLGSAIGLTKQKDDEGHKLMLKMSKPRKDGTYLEDVPSLIRLAQYCIQDVEVEYAVEQKLPPLPPSEERIWQLDQEINDRGVAIDIAGCHKLNSAVAKAKEDFNAEISKLTDGKVTTAGQRDKLLAWFEEDGVELEDMTKGSVTDALEGMPEGTAKRLLEIRQTASLASVAKLKSMVALANDDGRVRGSLLYYGATTGRWAGRGIQGQNLPRDSFKTEQEVEAVLRGEFEGCAIKAASRCIRGMITAAPGKHLTAVDFNAIEGRVLAWLAEEKSALDVYRNGLDPYKVAASAVYGIGYEDVAKDQRQVGKVAELALGYQGWMGAWETMAKTYDVVIGDEDRIVEIMVAWRNNRPKTTDLWAGLLDAALSTVKTGKAHRYGKIIFGIKGDFLFMRLPSGRMLAYPYPETEVQVKEVPATKTRKAYTRTSEVVTFMGVDTYTRQWQRLSTYGGKLTENAVQAIARDLLCEAMLTVDELGLPIVTTVHDEIVIEGTEEILHLVEKILAASPEWALDLPLAAEGWEAKRYRK